MDQKLLHSTQPYNARQRKSKTWQSLVRLLACVTILVTAGALVLPAITQDQKAYCGIEAHTHTESCFSKVTEHTVRYLACGMDTLEPHEHTDDCYRLEGGHSHTESCYSYRRGELKCSETGFHIHTGACFQRIATLTCELEESEGTQVLICTQPEGVVHVHDENCWKAVPEDMLTCQLAEDASHTHGPQCYGVWALTCSREVHEHSLSCYSNPNADVEDPEYWQRLADRVRLTGIWAEDLLAMAEIHLGYTESTRNYKVLSDGETIRGYTRFGHWMNDPYGEWCAMYVSYCLSYAGVRDMPRHYSCSAWIEELKILDLYREADGFLPDPGDLIFFERGSDNSADHVGIVTKIIPADGENPLRIQTIEGNSNSRVQYMIYEANDPLICGYGQLPQNPAQSYPCGMDEHSHSQDCEEGCSLAEHTHSDACYDTINYNCALNQHSHTASCFNTDGTLACQMIEHIHSVECVARTVAYLSDDMRVYVTIRGVEELPLDLTLNVWAVNQQNDRASFDSMQSAVSQQIEDVSQYISDTTIFQMELHSGGTVYQLPETADVTVQVKFTTPVFSREQIEQATNLHAFLLEPEEAAPEAIQEDTTTPDTEESGQPEQAPGSPPTGYIPGPGGIRRNEPSDEEDEAGYVPSYSAQEPEDTSLENTGDGLTGLSYHSTGLTAFALALADNIQEGTFWTRVDASEDFNSDATYLIVSAEGNYALTGSQGNNTNNGGLVPVTVETVKGNTDYYVITGSDNANLRWNISRSGSSYTIQNQGTDNYLRMVNVQTGSYWGWPIYTGYLVYSGSGTVAMSYQTTENCWQIGNGNDYLRKVGNDSYFTYGSGSDGTYGSTSYYYSRNMMIFKLSDVTSLEIPQDPEGQDVNTTPGEAPEQPDYDPYIQPSGSKTGDTAVIDPSDDTVKVSGQYYSDPATSCLEERFHQETMEDYIPNDGKILTDKSVIYGDDDYDAFESYDPNTFGVTLSALGQEYPLSEEDVVITPVDIVFVLDVSGSMATSDNGGNANRAIDMTTAVNNAISHIMEAHPENRIGVVIYSSGAWEMLPLGRYTADNDQYFICRQESRTFRPTGHTANVYMVKGSASLRSEDGTSYADVGSDATQGLGTYTQAGIALGYELFKEVEDTDYTITIGTGEDERSYAVARQPVYILLSDGEPTHGTNLYMDVLAGPVYGDGNGNTNPDGNNSTYNPKGILGYYTILSANYYKRMAGIHYQNPALFFTIGMGINQTGSAPLVSTSGTGDHYKRAVLNPTVENITSLSGGLNAAYTVDQLKALLNGTFTGGQQIALRSNWPDDWTGVPQKYIPVLPSNPYASDYTYTDNAYFGRMTDEDLTDIFDEILETSIERTTYGFVLHERSSVDLVDYIGEGMEVKDDPVLRFGGQNYHHVEKTVSGNVTTYRYEGIYTDPYIPDCSYDLSEITITITTEVYPTATHQKVEMYIPDTALPTYTPELIGLNYYYEALPVRLIYQVGLTEESEQAVLDLRETGGELTFYTNLWQDPLHYAISTLFPSTGNPFYYDQDPEDGIFPNYHEHTIDKTENTTDTLSYSVDCHKDDKYFGDDQMIHVLHELGNNGKLVFKAEPVEIPVEKTWDIVNPDEQAPVELTLYKVVETISEDNVLTRTAKPIQTLTLTAEGGWKGSFSAPEPGEGWYYAIGETVPAYFTAFYGDRITAMVDGEAVEMSRVTFGEAGAITTTIRNVPDQYVLPETGGMGTHPYTAGGILLTVLAVVLLYYKAIRCRKEDFLYS